VRNAEGVRNAGGAKLSKLSSGSLCCQCRCRCSLCLDGQCIKCPRCKCKQPWLMGHCFGVMEQFFTHLLPAGIPTSPFHFRTLTTWECTGTGCPYGFNSSNPTCHLPLLLPAADVNALVAGGVRKEVGALCAAHLGSNEYDYGCCPQCGVGALRMRAQHPEWPPLLLVELGRFDGGVGGGDLAAPTHLPWTLDVARTMRIELRQGVQEYSAAAVVYNDGSHWWADLLCSRHFKRKRGEDGILRPCGDASYRYDGLEAGGKLRFAGLSSGGVILTSDPRYISLVLYRRIQTTAAK